MLEFKFVDEHISINGFNDLEIDSNLAVIVGPNGCGKSHFLQMIKNNKAMVSLDGTSYRGDEIFSKSYNEVNPLSTSRENASNILSVAYSLIQFKKNINPTQPEYNKLLQIAELVGKTDVSALTDEEIRQNFHIVLTTGNEFHLNFTTIFLSYYLAFDNNRYNESMKLSHLDQKAFEKKFGKKPWLVINDLMSRFDMKYKITYPDEFLHRDSDFIAELQNDLGQNVEIRNFSSGEKVMITLVMGIYSAMNHNKSFPKVLLLDELDSTLHPSMIKIFLDFIKEKFIDEMGLAVILTTHSPTMVALCPEEALITISNSEEIIRPIGKYEALSSLAEGINHIRIDLDNRRQVFVESNYDEKIYTEIYSILKNKLDNNVELSFISSGYVNRSDGTCDKVKDIVKRLRNDGNKTILGIVDWDLKDDSQDAILVIGKDERYTLENFILDPLIFSVFLMKEDVFDKSLFGLAEEEQYFQIPTFTDERLQKIIDSFFNVMEFDYSKFEQYEDETIKVKYICGGVVDIPTWYLFNSGHKIEDNLIKPIPKLAKFYTTGLKDLKLFIIKKVLEKMPNLIPEPYLNAFKYLQSI